MKIGIIGTGKMGGALGRLWASKGHNICFGSRDPQKALSLAATIDAKVRGGTIREVATFSEVIILSVPWHAARETLQAAGPLDGITLIDITNPWGPDGLLLGHSTSAAEEIAKWVPEARVVKAFNSIHYQNLDRPRFGTQTASLFYCGDDGPAKASVKRLVSEIGFEPIDVGDLKMARYLEPLAYLWVHLAFQQGMGADIAFKLLRR